MTNKIEETHIADIHIAGQAPYRQKLLTALDERDALLREALLREAAQPEQITPKQLVRLVSDNPDVQFSVKPIPKPTGDWRASASEWLKLMADEQESLSACYPGHAAAYDWWVQKPQMLRVLAEQVLTSKLNASPADEELRRDAEQTAAARDVLAERQRQISSEGWTPEHDDHHNCGELSLAAANYAAVSGYAFKHDTQADDMHPSVSWPWDGYWWKPSVDPRRNLVKAGALILAEIERLDRAAIAAEKREG